MKKLVTNLFIAMTGVVMVACNSGGNADSGGNGLLLSASTNQCTYGGDAVGKPLYNTSIIYTINGAIPGNQYILLAENTWDADHRNVPQSELITAESSTLTIVATCEYLQVSIVPPAETTSMTGSTNIFAVDITQSSSADSLVQSNSLQYTVNYIQ